MTAVEEYRKWRGKRLEDAVGLSVVLIKADLALLSETARADKAEAEAAEAVSEMRRLYGLVHSYEGAWTPYMDGGIEAILARHDAGVKP
jgi:hypothetical protein